MCPQFLPLKAGSLVEAAHDFSPHHGEVNFSRVAGALTVNGNTGHFPDFPSSLLGSTPGIATLFTTGVSEL